MYYTHAPVKYKIIFVQLYSFIATNDPFYSPVNEPIITFTIYIRQKSSWTSRIYEQNKGKQ